MENQNILRIVLSLAIIAAFFLPLYNESVYGAGVSAWALLTAGAQSAGEKELPASGLVVSVCMVVVLLCSIFLLIMSVLRRPTAVLVNLLPFLAILGFIIFSVTQSQGSVGEILQSFGTGFYIMFLSSFLLPFTSITVPATTNR